MSSSLYRKYRPQSFSEVIGQQHIKTTLMHELESDKVAHAYLFCGPRGLGKTTLARLLAKSLNCTNRKKGSAEPCNECQNCQELMNGNAIDVLEIDAASHTGVDNVRENIISTARFTPTKGRYKVFIIDEVHMLSTSAFNALLKTLEEPPAHALFILATTEIHKVPQTIISRCQRFDFKKVNPEQLRARLDHIAVSEQKKVDTEVLERVISYSDGCVRDAETLLSQLLTLDKKHITTELASIVLPHSDNKKALEFVQSIIDKNATHAITLVNELAQAGVDFKIFIKELLDILRSMLLLKTDSQLVQYTKQFSSENDKQLRKIIEHAHIQQLLVLIKYVREAEVEVKSAQLQQFPLEIATMNYFSAFTTSSVTQSSQPSIASSSTPTLSVKKVADTPLVPQKVKKQQKKKVNNNQDSEETSATKKSQTFIDITLEAITEKWGEVLTKLRDYSHSLASTLITHQPVKLEGDVVHIGYQYKFHHDRITEIKNKQAIEESLKAIFAMPLRVATVKVDKLPQNTVEIKSQNNALEGELGIDALAASFGGQVIE